MPEAASCKAVAATLVEMKENRMKATKMTSDIYDKYNTLLNN